MTIAFFPPTLTAKACIEPQTEGFHAAHGLPLIPRVVKKSGDRIQVTRCAHPECEAQFEIHFSVGDPDHIAVACPCCSTVKTMHRGLWD